MKQQKIFVMGLVVVSLLSSAGGAFADDFGWLRNLNVRAEANHSDFRAELSTRFKIGAAQVDAVLSHVGHPADAYMVFRLGEMSGRSPEYVLEKYRSGKSNGWGALAKSLGVKPGSKEFHALKSGDGFDDEPGKGKHSKEKKENTKGKK